MSKDQKSKKPSKISDKSLNKVSGGKKSKNPPQRPPTAWRV